MVFARMRTREELTISDEARTTHRFVTIEQVVRDERPATDDLDDLFERWGLKRATQECFWVITYDGDKRLNTIAEVARGGYHDQTVYIAPTIAAVYASGTDRFMVAHNHPGGPVHPSQDDLALTDQIMEAALLGGLSFEDHLIVGPKGKTFSFAEHGLMAPLDASLDKVLKQLKPRKRRKASGS